MSVAAGASGAHTLSCCDPLCCPIAPLLGGGCCHARIAPAADLPSVRAWGSVVDSRLASIDNGCRLQERQPFEPEAGGLCLAMPEHPLLDDLIRLPPKRLQDGHRILYDDLRDVLLGSLHLECLA